MSDLVRNPKDHISSITVHISLILVNVQNIPDCAATEDGLKRRL